VSRERDVTPRSCPLCGQSDAEPPTNCRLCKGTKLVDLATWALWAQRPKATSTSTTIDIQAIAAGRLKEVRNVVSGPRGQDLALRGEALLAVIESWKTEPADGRTRAEHYQLVNRWLVDTADAMRGIRRFK